MSKKMEELREFLCEELEDITKKVKKEGVKLQANDFQLIDFLTHSIKSIDTITAMEEYDDDDDEGYSERGRSSYASGGSSYARGRGRYARRDSMGRYSRDSYGQGGYNNGSYNNGSYGAGNSYRGNGYSRDDGKEEMLGYIRSMLGRTQDDRMRQMIIDWKEQIENM